MLELVPASVFSERYRIERDGIPLAEFKLSWLREGGDLVVEGVPHGLRREGSVSGAFLLTRHGEVLARADKPSAWRRRFEVAHDGRRYELDPSGWWGSRFELRRDGERVGSIARRHPFTRRAQLTVPPDLPLSVTSFLAALVALMWKRDSAAAASGGG